jgi:hypothetical protein
MRKTQLLIAILVALLLTAASLQAGIICRYAFDNLGNHYLVVTNPNGTVTEYEWNARNIALTGCIFERIIGEHLAPPPQ